MQIEIRGDKVIIDGYVNAVGRDSRPIRCQTGDFVEQVEPGAFRKALLRAKKIDLLLNHRPDRKLGSTEDGVLTLTEDNIGLRAHAEIGDEEAIEKARNKLLRGWSFGMYVNKDNMEQRSNAIPRRHLEDIDIFEVSLIDNTMMPYYAGTSVECRAEGDALAETRAFDDTVEVNEVLPDDYYSEREKQLEQLRAESQWIDAEKRLQELRYNPYHDPTNGRFTNSSGGIWGGVLFVGKGQKGNGQYVINQENFNVVPQATITPDPNVKMDIIIKGLQSSNIQYNDVQFLQKPLTSDEIIDKISGGDMTKGSCSSLAFAFIGNESGYDVTDYRGGESQQFFARTINIKQMVKSSGGVEFDGLNAIKSTMEALNNNVVEGKNYYLAVGQHAAIVRKNNGKFEYLEMQSRYSDRNKFHELTEKTLHDRFGAKRSRTIYGRKVVQSGVLIESEKLAKNSDFKQALGYINTNPNNQQKGLSGNVK